MIVTLALAWFAYAAILYDYNSKLNLVWLLGLPVGMAIGANKGLGRRMIVAMVLLVSALVALVAVVIGTNA